MSRHRWLDFAGMLLASLALWSLIGIAAATSLGMPRAAWCFLWALAGSGATLVAVGYVRGRLS